MGNYQYRARGETGNLISGTIEAASEQAVFQQLEKTGYTPISVREAASAVKKKKSLFKRQAGVKA